MKCPICKTELESKGFSVGESGATNYYFYCPECDHDYLNYGKEKEEWLALVPTKYYKFLRELDKVFRTIMGLKIPGEE